MKSSRAIRWSVLWIGIASISLLSIEASGLESSPSVSGKQRVDSMAAPDLRRRGKELARAVDKKFKETRATESWGQGLMGRVDISEVVAPYLPGSISFADAAVILQAGGFKVIRPRKVTEEEMIRANIKNSDQRAAMEAVYQRLGGWKMLDRLFMAYRYTAEIYFEPDRTLSMDANTAATMTAELRWEKP